MRRVVVFLLSQIVFLFPSVSLIAQSPAPAMMPMSMGGAAQTMAENILRHSASGTDLEPGLVDPPMLMRMHGNWMLMVHGEAIAAEQQQTGPRGHDKLYAVNWAMPMAQRSFGRSQLTLRTMLSLEPATISGRYYPELFQQGETAFGKAIIDGQHPHNLFMEIAAIYDWRPAPHALLTLYGGPVGDPALGPVAFPHRASAQDNPLAPLGHHLEDSTHIADEVATVGVAVRQLRLEASGFHGREPDENRWHISVGGLDSWSARATWTPTPSLAAQYSVGHLHSPEQLRPEEDVLRQTASLAWSYRGDKLLGGRPLLVDALALWGRNHSIGTPTNANGYLLEANLQAARHNVLWTRIENVDRTTDLLDPAPSQETVAGRVQAYTGGYAWRLWQGDAGRLDLGAQLTSYTTPQPLVALYGAHPAGVAIIVRFGLGHQDHTGGM